MDVNRDKEVAFWLDSAKRKRQEGQPATATTFENMAWLLGHPEGWLDWIKEQEKIALSQSSVE
jgi:hypothetical protein